MGSKRSKFINRANVSKWLSALGFSFPRNEAEEKTFDRLYSDYDHKLGEVKIDASKLIDEIENESSPGKTEPQEWKMAARNYGGLPEHIIEKMRKNQHGQAGSSEKD